MSDAAAVTNVGPGAFRVEVDGRSELVYVAGAEGDRWAFWNGYVFHDAGHGQESAHRPHGQATGVQPVAAPMPATVVNVLVASGRTVAKGETLILLEAMKMELPVRSMIDGTVTALHCVEGQRVQAGQTLVDVEG